MYIKKKALSKGKSKKKKKNLSKPYLRGNPQKNFKTVTWEGYDIKTVTWKGYHGFEPMIMDSTLTTLHSCP